MKKILFFLALLCTQLFAETWKDLHFGWNIVYFSDSTNHSLVESENYENIQELYFDFHSDLREPKNRHLDIGKSKNAFTDSVWISKYWMDDSLLNAPIVAEENLNLDDFRLLSLDSIQSFEISSIMDRRIKVPGDTAHLRFFKSLYFVYKKDSSYYAYCAVATEDPIDCNVLLSCIFQNDGTLNFGEIPSIDEVFNMDGCPTSSLPSSRNLRTKEKDVSPSYNAKGKPADKNSSGVSLQKGVSKVNLKK